MQNHALPHSNASRNQFPHPVVAAMLSVWTSLACTSSSARDVIHIWTLCPGLHQLSKLWILQKKMSNMWFVERRKSILKQYVTSKPHQEGLSWGACHRPASPSLLSGPTGLCTHPHIYTDRDTPTHRHTQTHTETHTKTHRDTQRHRHRHTHSLNLTEQTAAIVIFSDVCNKVYNIKKTWLLRKSILKHHLRAF